MSQYDPADAREVTDEQRKEIASELEDWNLASDKETAKFVQHVASTVLEELCRSAEWYVDSHSDDPGLNVYLGEVHFLKIPLSELREHL